MILLGECCVILFFIFRKLAILFGGIFSEKEYGKVVRTCVHLYVFIYSIL